MSQLPGTVLANTALRNLGISLNSRGRLYTQKRRNDRTHKLYASLTKFEAEQLVREITKLGGLNARVVRGYNYYVRKDWISGVRFEVK